MGPRRLPDPGDDRKGLGPCEAGRSSAEAETRAVDVEASRPLCPDVAEPACDVVFAQPACAEPRQMMGHRGQSGALGRIEAGTGPELDRDIEDGHGARVRVADLLRRAEWASGFRANKG